VDKGTIRSNVERLWSHNKPKKRRAGVRDDTCTAHTRCTINAYLQCFFRVGVTMFNGPAVSRSCVLCLQHCPHTQTHTHARTHRQTHTHVNTHTHARTNTQTHLPSCSIPGKPCEEGCVSAPTGSARALLYRRLLRRLWGALAAALPHLVAAREEAWGEELLHIGALRRRTG